MIKESIENEDAYFFEINLYYSVPLFTKNKNMDIFCVNKAVTTVKW